jgi:hypothetical protein
MTLQEQRDIIQAAIDGKEIEGVSVTDPKRHWSKFFAEKSGASFNFQSFAYRVKPVPREFWINRYEHQVGSSACNMHPTRQAAIYGCSLGEGAPPLVERIHVREIID